MADLPLFPTEDNKETLKDYVNIQKQLNDLLLKQAKLCDNIGHINLSLESRVRERYKEEKRLLDLSKQLNKDYQIYYNQTRSLGGIAKKNAELKLKSMKDEIRDNQTRITQMGMMNDLEISRAKKMYEENTKWGNLMRKIGADQFGIKNEEYALTKSIGEQLEKYPFGLKKAAGILGAFVAILAGAYKLFQKFDAAAWNFRKTMGMTRNDAAQFRATAEKLAIEFAHIGVTVEGAYKSVLALREQMGSAFTVSSDLVKNVSILSSQLGVSEAHSAGFLRNMAALSKSTMQSQQDMMYIAADMSRAAGVPLDEVMGDIAKASSKTLTMMSRFPNTILRTAIEARRMGTTIDGMAKSSRSLLDFSESVNAEMDASVLLGRSINLQRARELAYRRDLEGSTKEILRITKQIDFENLDVFQQEAFAKATGRSVEELLKMVQAERQWDKARKDPNLKGKIEGYEKLRKSNEATVRANAKNYELELSRRANQERLTAITNHWNQIMMKAQKIFLPIIDGILVAVNGLMEVGVVVSAIIGHMKMFGAETMKALDAVIHIGRTISQVGKSIKALGVDLKSSWIWKLGGVVQKIGSKIATLQHSIASAFNFSKVGGFFGKIFSWFGKVGTFFAKIGSWVGKAFSFLGKFGAVFGKFAGFLGFIFKWVPVLGWVITAIQFVVNLFGRLSGIGEAFKGGILNGIWFGLKAIGLAIYDTILKPFVDAWNWIKGIFVGNSPSTLAMGILKGVVSVQAMLFDAITYPWRKALAWIFDKIPGMGKVAEKLRGGVKAMLDEPVEKKATAAYVPAVTVTPEGTKVAGTQTPQQQQAAPAATDASNNTKTLQDILTAINALNANLEAGKIGFYVDGQLLSATLARQSEFRGGYGVNKV